MAWIRRRITTSTIEPRYGLRYVRSRLIIGRAPGRRRSGSGFDRPGRWGRARQQPSRARSRAAWRAPRGATRRPSRKPASSSSLNSSSRLASRARWCCSRFWKTRAPRGVRWTSTTRRSSASWRRSMTPRAIIRLTIPVALATETSSASARRPIDSGPSASSRVRTLRWTRLSAPRCHLRNAPIRSRGLHDVSSVSRSSARDWRRTSAGWPFRMALKVNDTLII